MELCIPCILIHVVVFGCIVVACDVVSVRYVLPGWLWVFTDVAFMRTVIFFMDTVCLFQSIIHACCLRNPLQVGRGMEVVEIQKVYVESPPPRF